MNPRSANAIRLSLLTAIFVLALGVRLYGINFGLPYAEEVDEPANMDIVVRMVRTGDYSPHHYYYPAFYLYLQSAVTNVYARVAEAQGTLSSVQALEGVHYPTGWISQPDLYLWARALNALIGAATVLVLYRAARELYSSSLALIASAVLALTFLHVQYSHYIRTDITLTFFATLTLYFAARLYKTGRLRDYVLAGIAIGLTVAGKYNGFLISIIVLAAHVARVGWPPSPDPFPRQAGEGEERNEKDGLQSPLLPLGGGRGRGMGVRAGRGIRVLRAHLPLLLAAVVSVIAFFATSPTALFEWNLLMEGLQNGTDTFSFSGLQLDNLSHYLGYFMFRGGLGDLLTLLALLGMAVAILRHRALDLVAIAFPITYFVLILLGSAEMVRIRMALPLTPFLALFAALGLFTLAEILAARSRRFADWQPAALALVTVALLAGPGFKTWQDDNGMARPTNRALATAWAQTNLPAGARVVSTEDGIYLNPPLIQAKPIASLQAVRLNDLRQVGADYVVATENPTEKPAVDPALTLVQSFGDESGTQGVVRIYSLPPLPLPLTLIDGSFEHERYAPNQAATLTLHWQALAPLMENYVEFIRLTHSATGASFETSGKPQAANGNTKRWPVGKIVTDTHRVDLPPEVAPGLYQVEVGFYREGTEYAMGLHAGAGTVYRSLPIGFVRIAPPPAPAGAPQERLEANFDHAIQLSGYTVSTSRPAPGTVLRLDLFWSASSAPPVTGNYARFVHLVDSQGRLIAQRDGVPCEGACPPGVWLPGETFQDGVGIELPADAKPGRYRLIVGWYDYPTMRRLSTDAGQDAIELTTVEVEP